MDKKYILANWKMNGDKHLIQQYHDFFSQHTLYHHMVICPPFSFLEQIKHQNYHVGAQDCHFEKSGAFTGSISPTILKGLGTKYVILGHCERRSQYSETNELVCKKAAAALDADIIPIFCIGETLQAKENGQTAAFIEKQLQESIPKTQKKMIIAYEPVWAIGTGKVPTPEYIQNVHALIYKLYPKHPILYGGSVNKQNCQAILNIENVNGVLVGGASLDISFFETLMHMQKK